MLGGDAYPSGNTESFVRGYMTEEWNYGTLFEDSDSTVRVDTYLHRALHWPICFSNWEHRLSLTMNSV